MVSSIGALDGLPGQASYVASKAGILGLVRHTGRRMGVQEDPGKCRGSRAGRYPKVMAMPRDIQDRVLANVAQKRLVSGGEGGGSIAFLMSPAAGAITGQSLRVDVAQPINTVGLHR